MSGPSKSFNSIGERAAGLLDSLYDNTIGAMVERGRESMRNAGAAEGGVSVAGAVSGANRAEYLENATNPNYMEHLRNRGGGMGGPS